MYSFRDKIKLVFGSAIITLGLLGFLAYQLGFLDRWIRPSAENRVVTGIKNGGTNLYSPGYPSSSPPKIVHKVVDRHEKDTIDIYKQVSPAVVNVTKRVLAYNDYYQPFLAEGAGSGCVVDKKGHILTNYHVIKDANELIVTLSNNARYKAKIIGFDPDNDLAVLQIKAPKDFLFPIKIAKNPQLEVGQKVLAIGNPFGLDRTLTTGIISSLGRTMNIRGNLLIHGVIQTDAAINPGNSGGPLLNTAGELIGINTFIIKGSVGLGFAVPSQVVRQVLKNVIRHGTTHRLGVLGYPLDWYSDLYKYIGLPVKYGVVIVKVQKGFSAEKAGLLGSKYVFRHPKLKTRIPVGGDVIVAVDGQNVKTPWDITLALEKKKINDIISIDIVRYLGDRKYEKLKINLTLLPSK